MRPSCYPGSPVSGSRVGAGATRLVLLLALGACTPELDWREVSVPDTPLLGQLPCRPGRFERAVVVAGTPLRLFMLSCEAGGVTFGLASAEVGDPGRVEAVLDGLAQAARGSLHGGEGAFVAYDLPGATPFRGNASARLRGRRPDGVSVQESLRVFARGTRVYEASAIGPALPPASLAPFEDGLRFDLDKGGTDPR
jgi:hypothetical protein